MKGKRAATWAVRWGVVLVAAAAFACSASPGWAAEAETRPRLLVLTDIGGDPDDTQSLVRLLLYSNEFEIEGFVASASGTPGELKEKVTRLDLIREKIAAYGKVRDNLTQHASGYPTAANLLSRVHSGNHERGRNAIGEGHDTDGSRAIIAAADRTAKMTPARPLNISIWGGQTDLAQALWRIRADRGKEGLRQFAEQTRIYDIADQDGLASWIQEEFPGLFYILAQAPAGKDKRLATFRGMYLGGDESLTSKKWIQQHIQQNHGPLGALYPLQTWTAPNPHSTLKEGDTPSWFYFLPTGLSDAAHPAWGSWGGRFQKDSGGVYRDAADTVEDVTDARVAVWRWRPAFQNDFAARMDWSVRPPAEANHPPRVTLPNVADHEVFEITVNPGKRVQLSFKVEDPDGDRWNTGWWPYREAGSGGLHLDFESFGSSEITWKAPNRAGGSEHWVLEVTDHGEPPLTRYRRVVIHVTP